MPGLAVLDRVPIFRLGVLAAVGPGGTELKSEDEAAAWAAQGGGTIFCSVETTAQTQLLPTALVADPRVNVVVVLDPFTVVEAARLLRAGAVNVIDRRAPAAEFRQVAQDTAAGRSMIDHAILRAAVTATDTPTTAPLDDRELTWLRQLAAGASVTSIAGEAAFSERMMYRKLTQVYRRLGVENRAQALVLARGQGWV